jgi:hypothetical protein
MQRSLSILFWSATMAVSVLMATLAGPAWCAGQDWMLLDENKDSSFYYDQSGHKEAKEGIVRVMTRTVYTKQGKAEALKMLKNADNLKNLSESRYLHDLNCDTEQSRLLEASHLDKKGVTLKSTDLASATEWEEIPPNARMRLVLQEACASVQSEKSEK